MKKKEKQAINKREKQWKLSFQPVVRYILWFCALMVVAELCYGVFRTVQTMQTESITARNNAQAQLEYRVGGTIKLLTSLRNEAFYNDPAVTFDEKAMRLVNFSDTFGFMMLRIVDKDINVYNEKGLGSNLAGREYMQRMFSTGEIQVTDSFAAGRDGETLQYTIAAPLFKDGVVNGGLFAAIYFDELKHTLESCATRDSQELALFGSKNQAMTISSPEKYGKTYQELADNALLLGATAQQVEANMFNGGGGEHWAMEDGDLIYVAYVNIANTNWTVMTRTGFWGVFLPVFPELLLMILISIAICVVLSMMASRFIKEQMTTVDMLVDSVQELERKIYQNEKPNEVDFKEIISLTSKGLTDGLTGVITRTVFLSQVKPRLAALDPQKIAALCFVDVDELKQLNDHYGHGAGDMALKSVGYILREYEKKYDGLVGRYGGDEFVLLLSQIAGRKMLEELLDELAARLHAEVSTGEAVVLTHCSIGVAICAGEGLTVERLIEQADEALYAVKQSGKGTYRIYGGK